MTDDFDSTDGFDWQTYEDTAARLLALKSQLAETDVKSLADEVLKRLKARAGSVQERVTKRPPRRVINALTRALVAPDSKAGMATVRRLLASGASVEDVYLLYLAEAARRLGDWWDSGDVTFAQVSVATSRIFAILRMLDAASGAPTRSAMQTALFAAPPDATHTLGVRMATDLMRRQGWQIDLCVGMSHEELIATLERSDHMIIGLTSAGRHSVAALTRLMLAIRIHRPTAFVLISGQIVEESADLVEGMSPDAIAQDFPTAQQVLEEFLREAAGRAS